MEETPKESVFHPDNVAAYTLMTLLQLRDIGYLQVYIAASGDEKHESMVDQMEDEHAAGRLLFPPPYVA